MVAFSCKKRGVCPSCAAKRAVKFADHLYEEVMADVPHRHMVLTIPKRLRSLLKYDRSLNDVLFKAASSSIDAVLGGSGTPGVVLTVQSVGEALNPHPHLHGLITDGTFSSDGIFTKFATIDSAAITVHFADHVLAALRMKGLIAFCLINHDTEIMGLEKGSVI